MYKYLVYVYFFFQLKFSRIDFILSYEKLLPLIPILEKCCSDDETDTEMTTPSNKVCMIRRFEWRSTVLEQILIKIDECKKMRKENSPKGAPGLGPRTRTRDQRNPINPTEAPARLPIDCYDHNWLYPPGSQEPRINVEDDQFLDQIHRILAKI